MTSPDRVARVPYSRLQAWVAGIENRNAGIASVTSESDGSVELHTGAGGVIRVSCPVPRRPRVMPATPEELAPWLLDAPLTGVVMVRRGGYAVGVWDQGEWPRHRAGSRYVQGKTAAGGWSQQRFQRRRTNQAQALVGAVSATVHDMWKGHVLQAIGVGGDRELVRELWSSAALSPYAELPRAEAEVTQDPTFAVLSQGTDLLLGAVGEFWDAPTAHS